MGLEAVTWISDLVITNPVGATDPKSQGDDHIRNIKIALKNCFANITGAVTATQAQINQTCVGTGGTFPAINGSALTALNASALASGTVADARLSANVPLLNINNSFVQNLNGNNIQTIQNQSTGVSAITGLNLTNSADTLFLRLLSTGFSGTHLTGQAAGEAAMLATSTALQLGLGTNAICRLNIDGSGNFDFKGGLVTTNNASAQEVGTKGIVFRGVSASDHTVALDSGRGIVFTGSTAGQTFTLDANPPTNSVVTLINESSQNWTIAGSVALIFGGVTASRTLPPGCMATAVHRQGSGTWQIAGQLT